MPTRRKFITTAVRFGATVALAPLNLRAAESIGIEVNDVQSQLNATRVHSIVQTTSVDAIQLALRNAQRERRMVSVAGGRHAMGGQQFGRETILIDTKAFNSVISFDKIKGHIEVQAGIEWPDLIDYLIRASSRKTARAFLLGPGNRRSALSATCMSSTPTREKRRQQKTFAGSSTEPSNLARDFI